MVARTRVPKNPIRIPQILGFYSPARGGTTALALMMASHPRVERSYFQPHKNTLRWGNDFVIEPTWSEGIIAIKDTFGPIANEELFDPIDLMVRAGILAKNLTIIFSLRNPIFAARSIDYLMAGAMNPNFYFQTQQHIINLFLKYREELGERIIPFSFDLMANGQEKFVFERLLKRTRLRLENSLPRKFDQQAIARREGKVVWGEAENIDYYNQSVASTVRQGELRYVKGTIDSKPLDLNKEQVIRENCMDGSTTLNRG